MTSPNSNVPVEAAQRTLRIIEYIHDHETSGVSEIADSLDISKSTVHNHLQTLQQMNYVETMEGEYKLGLKFLELAGGIQARYPLFESIKQKVRQLSDETNEICLFVVDDRERVVVMYIEEGSNAAKTNIQFGQRIPEGQIVAGRAIENAKEADIRDDLGDTNCVVDDETFIEGLRSVAAPLSDMEGRVHGALSITGPVHRLRDDEYESQIIDQLLNVVNELELAVSYSRY